MASPVDTSVKFFNEGFPGAPVLNGVAGSLLGLLDACLCTGFGLRTATSLVVSGGVATLTLGDDAKNPNLLRSVILVEGVTGTLTALNGEQRVTFASTTELKFATAAADGTATGTITVKTAPAGWEKKFPGTNTAAFKSLDATSLGAHLWVNDAGTINANVRLYESMTGVDTGTGAAPTVAESASGSFWMKSGTANANANRWDFFADSRSGYYCPVPQSGATPSYIGQPDYAFGDVIAYKSGDAFAAAVFGSAAAPGSSAQNGSVLYGGQGGGGAMSRFLRSYTGLGSSISAHATTASGAVGTASGLDATQGPFPAPADGGLRLAKIYCTEGAQTGTSAVLRGEMPGVYYCPQTELYKSFQRGDTIAFGGRTLYVVYAGSASSDTSTQGGRGFIDITGPWR